MLPMSSKLYSCDECGEDTPRDGMVDQYRIDVHSLRADATMSLCPKCAAAIEARDTHGDPEEWIAKTLSDSMRPSYGVPVVVRWIQGDEHVALVHVRLAAP